MKAHKFCIFRKIVESANLKCSTIEICDDVFGCGWALCMHKLYDTVIQIVCEPILKQTFVRQI